MQIKNLTKKYGEKTVYENFSLNIEDGKITCILGESGSGKTTLLNCVAGLCEYFGEITKVKCSYVFQTPRLVPNLTVRGNLALICNDERVDELIKKLHLENEANSYPAHISGGQAQRVSLARAILFGGDIMLMDEPFSSLDLKLKREIQSLYKSLQKEYNLTVLFVTHDIDEAVVLADRIVVIKDGKAVLDEKNGENMRERLISALIGA